MPVPPRYFEKPAGSDLAMLSFCEARRFARLVASSPPVRCCCPNTQSFQYSHSRACGENISSRRRNVVANLDSTQGGRFNETFLLKKLVVDVVASMPNDLDATEQGELTQYSKLIGLEIGHSACIFCRHRLGPYLKHWPPKLA